MEKTTSVAFTFGRLAYDPPGFIDNTEHFIALFEFLERS